MPGINNRILGWLLIALLIAVGAFALSSCARYQPPGEDLWIGVQAVEKKKAH